MSCDCSQEKSISDEEVPECISDKIDEGWDQDQAVAACLEMARTGSAKPDGTRFLQLYFDSSKDAIIKAVEDVDTVPTQEMADIASEVLEKIDDSDIDNDDCGTRVGLERANQLENREELSADTIGRMVSFFARHDGNQSVDEGTNKWEDCGFVAWRLWGGDPGRDWANRKLEEIEDEREEDSKTNTMTDSKEDLKESIQSQNRENVKSKSFMVKGEDVEIVKQDSESEPVVNIPIQSLAEDRDGDIINEKGQKSIITQLQSGTVPLVPNHGIGKSDAHYGFEDIFGQFVDGENRNGTTIGTARLLEGNEYTDKLVKLLENDMPVGFSVGFRILEADERKDSDTGLEISEVDLMEVSAVGIPSNPDAVPQAMSSAVAMAKSIGMDQDQIVDSVRKAFETEVKDIMSEKEEGENTEQNSKSEDQKQLTSEDVEMLMEAVASKVGEHISMAMDEAEDEIMGMLDEEEPDEMEEETDGQYEDDEEEMNSEPEKDASDHTEDEKSAESEDNDQETDEEKDVDVANTAEKNKQSSGKMNVKDNDTDSEETEEKNLDEVEDPFAVRQL